MNCFSEELNNLLKSRERGQEWKKMTEDDLLSSKSPEKVHQ